MDTQEYNVFQVVLDIIGDIIEHENLPEDSVVFAMSDKAKQASVSLQASLVMYIKLSGKLQYIAVPADIFHEKDKPLLSTVEHKFAQQFIRFPISGPLDVYGLREILRCVFNNCIYSIPKQFDCCSRYVQCSDAMRCINPNKELAIGCGYKKNLQSGIAFYGKNAQML